MPKTLVQVADNDVLFAVRLGKGGDGMGDLKNGALHGPILREIFHANELVHRYLCGGVPVDPAELPEIYGAGLRPVDAQDLRPVLQQVLRKVKASERRVDMQEPESLAT